MCGSYIESARMCVVASGMKKFRRFLRSMFYIGCIGVGGGSALISIIEQEIAASIGRRGFGRKGMIAGLLMKVMVMLCVQNVSVVFAMIR